jgi:hypothetical protein
MIVSFLRNYPLSFRFNPFIILRPYLQDPKFSAHLFLLIEASKQIHSFIFNEMVALSPFRILHFSLTHNVLISFKSILIPNSHSWSMAESLNWIFNCDFSPLCTLETEYIDIIKYSFHVIDSSKNNEVGSKENRDMMSSGNDESFLILHWSHSIQSSIIANDLICTLILLWNGSSNHVNWLIVFHTGMPISRFYVLVSIWYPYLCHLLPT